MILDAEILTDIYQIQIYTLMNFLLEFFIEIIIDLEMKYEHGKLLIFDHELALVVLYVYFYHVVLPFLNLQAQIGIWSLFFKTLDYN